MSKKFIIKSASDRTWTKPNPLDNTPLKNKVKKSRVKNIDCGLWATVWIVEVKSLAFLLRIMKESGHNIIIQQDEYRLPSIVIYDDYNE
jgi:hypothetical protein